VRWYTGCEGRAGGGAEWIGSRGLVRTYLLQVTRKEATSEADKGAAVAGGAHAIHGAWHAMTCPRVPAPMRRVRDGTLMVDDTLQRNVALSSVRAAEKQSERRGQREQGRAGQGRAGQGSEGADPALQAKPDSWVARRPLRPTPAAALA
jgi:hypothetical protein